MKSGCMICGKPLVYLETSKELECYYCHKKGLANATCEDGHFVCNECHAAQGIKSIIDFADTTRSKNPIEIARQMMENPFIHMHGNEHHVLVGAALLIAFHNAGGEVDLHEALGEIKKRGSQIPGGVCGFWGSCGAAISSGIFVALISGSTPLKNREWALSNYMTSQALKNIADLGGPRCCKRNTFTSIKTAVAFTEENFGVKMELPDKIFCTFNADNKQCIGLRCPYFKRQFVMSK